MFWRTLPWAGVLAGVAVLLCLVPLFDVLGYESSLALGLLVAVAGAHLGARAGAETHPASRSRYAEESPLAPFFAWGRGTFFALGTLLLPLALLLLNALRVRNCDLLEGMAFYALLPVVAAAVGAGWGAASGVVTGAPRKGFVLALLMGGVSLLWALVRLYREPQVVAFASAFGYWPGTLYDEEVGVGRALVFARLFHLLLAGAAVSLAGIAAPLPGGRLRLGRLAPLVLLGGGVVVLHAAGPELGFRLDGDRVRQALGATRKTAHFTLHHPREWRPAEVDALADDLEYRLYQTSRFFGLSPKVPDHCSTIEAYLYDSVEQRRTLTGLGATSMARPWNCQIHLVRPLPGEGVVAHEVAHVVAGRMAPGFLHLPTRFFLFPIMTLVEGAAEAATLDVDTLDHHGRAAALDRLGLMPDLSSLLDSGGFFGAPPARAYAAAGSFVRWLIATEGVRKFQLLYGSGSPFLVYRKTWPGLVASWREFLARVPVEEADLRAVADRYRRPSIFERACAHESALVRSRAMAALARGDVEQAVTLFGRLCDFAPGDPDNLLALAEAYEAAGDLDRAEDAARRALARTAAFGTLRSSALRMLGDLAWGRGDGGRALDLFRQAEAAAGSGPEFRQVRARMAALGMGEGEESLRDFLTKDRDREVTLLGLVETAVRRPDHGLAPYLLGRHLWARRRPDRSVPYLRQALQAGAGDAALLLENRRLLGEALYGTGRIEAAIEVFRALDAAGTPPGLRAVAADWLERCAWKKRGSRGT